MPAKKNFEAELIKLIEDEIAKDPFELDGHKWAVLVGQDGLADHLGVATKTLARRLKLPPFKHRNKRIDGEARTLLRIREPGEPDVTPGELRRLKLNADRKAMGFAWKEKIGKWPNLKQSMLLWGFAVDLAAFPIVEPAAVFKFALTNWHDAASAIKLAQLATPGGKVKYFDYPSIGPIRRFWKAVVYAYVSKLMWGGKVPPDKLNAFAAILMATEFGMIPDDVPYADAEHVAMLVANKEAKIAAAKEAEEAEVAANMEAEVAAKIAAAKANTITAAKGETMAEVVAKIAAANTITAAKGETMAEVVAKIAAANTIAA